jgi:hypothetical protein
VTAKSRHQLTKPDTCPSVDADLAAVAHLPTARHAVLTGMIGSRMFGCDVVPDAAASTRLMAEETNAVLGGDLSALQRALIGQAVTLDATFTELARRSFANMGENLNAAERYMRLALKAQAGCRATIEAIDKLQRAQQPNVRHVHVSEGAQAIVADQFHHHAPTGPY